MICRFEDDNRRYSYLGERSDLPFPFYCTRPPVLGFLETSGVDGFVEETGYGVAYRRLPAGAHSAGNVIRVSATSFRLRKAMAGESLHRSEWGVWMGEAVIGESVGEGSRILSTETQEWMDADDWTWVSMERRSGAGTVMMRCRRIRVCEGR
jgi:hypothetical protein